MSTLLSGRRCEQCTSISATYFLRNGRPICESCTKPDSNQRSAGVAILLALGAMVPAALAGAGLWCGALVLLHRPFGLAAAVAGFVSGSAIRLGASGYRGPHLAAFGLLSYAASVIFLPALLGFTTLLDAPQLIMYGLIGAALAAYRSQPPVVTIVGPFDSTSDIDFGVSS